MTSDHQLSSAEELLLALCANGQGRDAWEHLDGPDADAIAVGTCELAARHGVLGLMLTELEKHSGLHKLSASVAEQMRESLRFVRRQSVMWQFECWLVLQRLGAAGLHPVVLKGAALQATVYDEPAQRTFGDIDLLFPEGEVSAAIEALGPVGYLAPPVAVGELYREVHFHYVLAKANGFKVEVHWALERPGSPYNLDPKLFLAAAAPVTTRTMGEFLTPRAEFAALHLCVQNVENGFARLSRLVDVDRLVSGGGFDWLLFRELAVQANARVVVALTLELCSTLLHTKIAPGLFDELRASPAARWHLSLLHPVQLVLEQQAYTRPAVEALVNMWCRDSMRDRGALVHDLLRGSDAELTLATNGSRSVRSGLWWNSVGLFKLLLYQLWLYGANSTRTFTRVRA